MSMNLPNHLILFIGVTAKQTVTNSSIFQSCVFGGGRKGQSCFQFHVSVCLQPRKETPGGLFKEGSLKIKQNLQLFIL